MAAKRLYDGDVNDPESTGKFSPKSHDSQPIRMHESERLYQHSQDHQNPHSPTQSPSASHHAPNPVQNDTSINAFHLWHRRLGHTAFRTLKNLGFVTNTNKHQSFCEACAFGKQTRLPYRQYEHNTPRRLWRVHSDMSGIQELSIDGKKYFITFIDDFSRYCWIYFTLHKDAKTIRDIYEIWRADAENKAGEPVSYLQTDVGGEYQKQMAEILKTSGVTHLKSPPYSHESNGLAERQNRTLKDTARTLLHQAHLPSSFWTKAVQAACQIRNRLPHSNLQGISPHEAFFNEQPSLDHFRIFGSLCYIHIPEERRPAQSAWNDRATKGIIVGYPSTTLYEYYDLTRRKFGTEHNLTIHENMFATPQDFNPSASSQPAAPQSSNPPDPPTPKPLYDMIVVQNPPKIVNSTVKPTNEKPTYEVAIQGPDRDQWIKAMNEEIRSIEQNQTWRLVKLPPGRKAIGVKWVLTVKRDAKGAVLKHKARLVAKGYSQQFGFDFDETYAPVVRIEHVRILFSLAAFFNLPLIHLDAKNAFLHGNSDFAIYVKQPPGFENPAHPDSVLLLLKSLYGLKQASRIWYLALYDAIINLGFESSKFDPCIFISPQWHLLLAIYVDDILVMGPQVKCDEFANQLSRQFRITNQGHVSSFLGINVERRDGAILLNQIGYIDRMAQRFQLESCNPTFTPLDHSLPLLKAEPESPRADGTLYKELTGSLNHLAICTRPDTSLSVSKLSQFNQDPTITHHNAARRILKYAISTKHYSIKYGGINKLLQIDGYADADWGSNLVDRKSTTGFIFMMNGGPISWKSGKQTTVALSTMEAELMALSDAAREILAHLTFFQTLSIELPLPILYTDNEAAESVAKHEPEYQRSKHIDIRYHFIRDHFEKGTFDIQHIPGNEQIADILTKPLPRIKHQAIVQALRLN